MITTGAEMVRKDRLAWRARRWEYRLVTLNRERTRLDSGVHVLLLADGGGHYPDDSDVASPQWPEVAPLNWQDAMVVGRDLDEIESALADLEVLYRTHRKREGARA